MTELQNLQRYFYGFITLYTITGIGAMTMGFLWLGESADGAPRDAVISREIEMGKFFF